jgi:hypothetical protein
MRKDKRGEGMSIIDEIERQRAELEREIPFLPRKVTAWPSGARPDKKVKLSTLQPLRATGVLLGGVRFAELMRDFKHAGDGFGMLQFSRYRGLTVYRLLGHEHRDLVRVIGERDPEMLR